DVRLISALKGKFSCLRKFTLDSKNHAPLIVHDLSNLGRLSALPLKADIQSARLAGATDWPLVMQRSGTPEQINRRLRRADALALIAEESVRSYPSWITELDRKSANGIDRRRYSFEQLGPGEA